METKIDIPETPRPPALALAHCSASGTPRTDAFMQGEHVALDAMWIDFARTMERERAEWREKHWNAHHHAHQMFLDVTRLRTVLEEVDEALTEIGWHTDRGILQRVKHALGTPPNVKDEPRREPSTESQ